MSQTTYEYESNPGLRDVEALRQRWQNEGTFEQNRALYEAIYQAIQKTETGLVEINRKLREGQGDSAVVGSGGTPSAPSVSSPYVLCNVVFEHMAFGYNEYSGSGFEPATSVTFGILNREPARLYKPVFKGGEILEIAGDIWFEAKETGTPEHHHIRAKLVTGSPRVNGGNRLGFDVGFERYDSDRRKFFIDVFEYPQEFSNDDPTLIVNEIPITSRKFRSIDTAISEVNLSLYVEVGLWFKMDLSLFFR